MSRALYRKYRSKSLDEIVGQSHITDILSRSIKHGRISHAYLLTGPRGVGKTSIARILAHEINGLPYNDENHLDIIEIDAASNNGVEDVRDLREKVQMAPVSAAKKVYIIDEVHMLSKAAFNALLKTLEEPPEHVVFILATTDVDKLPATIISRTQHYNFRAMTIPDGVNHLRSIADAEKIVVDDEALRIIAERGDGSFRDSVSLLDQLTSLTDDKAGITAELVEISLGLAPRKLVSDIIEAVEGHDVPGIITLLDGANNQGISALTLAQQLTIYIRTIVAEKPQLLSLLDTLLDVARSGQPELKLLSVLGSASIPKQATKTAALATPVLEIKATVEELSKRPKITPVVKEILPIIADANVVVEPFLKEDVPSTASQTPQADSKESPVKRSPVENGSTTTDLSVTFNWKALIELTRTKHVAVYSVLSKCSFELEGTELKLYTSSAFYKKKLDDAKYSAQLFDCIKEVAGYELTVHTIPTAPPPKDSQAAAVAAIMGGGEEVSVETS